jgi:hypothetical protein
MTAEPVHPLNATAPDGVDVLKLAGMADRRSGRVDGAELSLIFVLAPVEDGDDDVLACIVGNPYHMGRAVGILQAQADVRGCRAALDAAADQGYEWAKRQMVGDRPWA